MSSEEEIKKHLTEKIVPYMEFLEKAVCPVCKYPFDDHSKIKKQCCERIFASRLDLTPKFIKVDNEDRQVLDLQNENKST